jgi:hypothetical protein
MQFFSADEIRNKIPAPMVDAFERSEFKYRLCKKELEKCKNDKETLVEDFLVVAQNANNSWLEWKGANLAVARFLNINRPVKDKQHAC